MLGSLARRFARTALFLAVLACTWAVVTSASAAPPPAVVGTVASVENPVTPLEGILVEAYSGVSLVATTTTDVLGQFSFWLPDGTYAVRYDPAEYNSAHGTHFLPTWYLNQPTQATAWPVYADTNFPATDASQLLDELASVGGTVSSSVDGTLLAGVLVTVRDGLGAVVGTTTTDPDGAWSVDGVPAGQTIVDYDPTAYNDAHPSEPFFVPGDSDIVDSVLNGSSTLNRQLDPLHVYGTVRMFWEWGDPLYPCDVELWDDAGVVATTSTDPSGLYGFYPRPGTYYLRFDPSRWSAANQPDFPLAPSFRWNTLTTSTANPVTPTPEAPAQLADMVVGYHSLDVNALTSAGTPLEGAVVHLYDLGQNEVATGTVGSDGHWRLNPAPYGELKAFLDTGPYNEAHDTNLPDQWYYNTLDVGTFEEATAFTVRTDQPDSIVFLIYPPMTVFGTITGGGNALADVDVLVHDWETDAVIATATTDADGHYLASVTPGRYVYVEFNAKRHNRVADPDFSSGWWDGWGWSSLYTGYPSNFWANVEGMQECSADLPPSIGVHGRIVGPSGEPLANVEVAGQAIAAPGVVDEWVLEQIATAFAATRSDRDGYYDLDFERLEAYLVPSVAGTKLHFTPIDPTYLGEWWDDKVLESEADTIPLVAYVQASADATLAKACTISGHVESVQGDPLPDVEVTVRNLGTGEGIWGWTDQDGDYGFAGLRPADYTVTFDPGPYNLNNGTWYAKQYWNGQSAEASADVLSVPTSGEMTGIDATLYQELADISGTVRDAGGAGLPGAGVSAFRLETWQDETGQHSDWLYVGGQATDENGHYSFIGLHAGDFRMRFDPPTVDYATEFWDDRHLWSQADTITASIGSSLTSIDATLEAAGRVVGHVLDDQSGEPVRALGVNVYAGGPEWEQIGSGQTDDSGSYNIAVSAEGPFRVEFGNVAAETVSANGTYYVPEVFSNKNSIAAGDDVSGGLGVTSTVDASLTPAAVITGTVDYDPIKGSVTVEALRDDGDGWHVVQTVNIGGGFPAPIVPAGGPQFFIDPFGDLDGDGIPNWEDPDIDGDGIPNETDPDPLNPNPFTGEYKLEGLRAGTYRVRFVDSMAHYTTQYWDNERKLAQADDIVLTPGQVRGAIDATMVPGGRIIGKIDPGTTFDGNTGTMSEVYIYGWNGTSWEFLQSRSTGFDGVFTSSGLDTGTYAVVAAAEGIEEAFIPEAWNNAAVPDFNPGAPQSYQPPGYVSVLEVQEGQDTVVPETIVLQSATVPDTGKPTSSSDAPAGWVNHDVVVHLSATDAQGAAVGTFGGLGSDPLTATATLPTITAEGATQIRFYAIDSWGNQDATKTATVKIDKTPPKTLDDHLPAYSETAFIRLYGTDTHSGPDETRYVLDGGPETIGGAVMTTETGSHTLQYWSTDKAGNTESPRSVTFSVGGDMDPPVTMAIAPTGWQLPPTSVELTAVDDISGVEQTFYSTDGSYPTVVYGGWFEITATGTHIIKFRSVDAAGNKEAPKFTAVWVDGTPPVTASSVVTGSTSATVTLTPVDPHSGVASTYYSVDGGAEKTGKLVTVSGAGTHTVEFWSADKLGNAEAPESVTFLIGDGAPATLQRIAGGDRFAVAANLARAGWNEDGTWTGVDHVIVANGETGKEADPLSAAGLAGAYDAPVLLTRALSLPSSTKSVITEIAAKRKAEGKTLRVHLIGGTASVPDARWNEIRAIPGVSATKDRIAGSDRYQVSANIANRMISVLGMPQISGVLLVNAEKPDAFYDALAVSPIAYSKRMPMIGVRTLGTPSTVSATLATLKTAGKPVFAASGTGWISNSVVAAWSAQRLATSPDRYTAAVSIATTSTGTNAWLSNADVGLAAKLPDSLAGGAFMGKRGGPLLFTDTNKLPPMKSAPEAYITDHAAEIANGWIFGGEGSVYPETEVRFGQLLQ